MLFDKMKTIVTESPVLAYLDHNKPVTLGSDKYGSGSVIFQDVRPVAFASKTLTHTEAHYTDIERKLNAIVFACTRFQQYVYGRTVTVHSDNKM
jgi:hypothetical protein